MDKLSSPAPASFTTITRTMSTSKQPGAEQAAAAPRRSLLPVPAKRVQGQKLKKPVFCPAPCCVQARGGERPLGPDAPYQVPDDAEQAEEEGGEGPNPTLPHLGQLRQERRRRRREEERRCVRLHKCTAGQRSECESHTKWRGTDTLEKPRDKPNLKL